MAGARAGRSPHLLAVLAALALAASGSRVGAQVEAPRGTVEASQQDVDARAARARAAERAGDVAKAAEGFLELVALQPDELAWVVGAGRNLGAAGRFNDALDVLEPGLRRFPGAAEVPALLARVHTLAAEDSVRRGVRDQTVTFEYHDAVRNAERALAIDENHRDARLILAQARYSLGERDAAETVAKEAARRFPDHPGPQILIGKINFDRFIEARTALASENPRGKRLEELTDQAHAARRAAEAALVQATDIDPDRAFPHAKLGDIQAWLGNVPATLEHYTRALAIDPAAAVPHTWVSDNLDPAKRASMYEAAAANHRKRPDADEKKVALLDWYAAYAHLAAKNWAKAEHGFVQAYLANNTYLNSLFYAMQAAYWAKRMDEAEVYAAKYGELGSTAFADLVRGLPDNEQYLSILEFLAQRSYDNGRLPFSRDINLVLAKLKDDAEHWNNHAFLSRETGQYEAALRSYETALTIERENPQLLNDCAVILQYHLASPANLERARRMYEEAIQQSRRVLADPESTDEMKRLARQAAKDAAGNIAKLDEDARAERRKR